MARILVVAGTASGVGKTTITLGLLEAFRRRGLVVQAFKVGPDFIDPGFHELVSGRPSYSLDGWMCGRDHVRATVARHAADVDLVLVEGVMGCFDGADPTSDDGSTAQVAKWLHAPVVLVIDASAQARSSAAVVRGFESFDPDLGVAAIIANRLGGEAHARLIREAMRGSCRAELVGGIPRDPALELPERHLGLVTAIEGVLTGERRERLATTIERSVDLDRLLAIASPLPSGGVAAPIEGALRAREIHARALAENVGVVKALADRAGAGTPIYAECGGLMYLAAGLEDADGMLHSMVGVLPAAVSMRSPRLTLGYSEVRFVADTPLGAAGTTARGHEFHCSTLGEVSPQVKRAYRVRGRGRDEHAEGFLIGRTLLSYVHLHFGSNPALAVNFVAACAAASERTC
ncbi:MAG: hypothetical protein AUG80_13985 [Candidatus Rokubacteria bacterium 13_1_20CM_4_68_9]|nr:MAG: hypothetical protein AUG80_13985 [Candidatus Rokubacteria bacterium 13_1_20CM_4_68_9]